MVDYLPAYFLKLYREGVLSIFALYYQDLAREAKWINNQLYYEDELELNDTINDKADLEWIIDKKYTTKKYIRIYEEDNATI